MPRNFLIIVFCLPFFANASSIDAISSTKNGLNISNISIAKFAEKLSLEANAGWKKIAYDDGVSRVRAGDGFLEGLVSGDCKTKLALIDILQKEDINTEEINNYCKSLVPGTAQEDAARRSISNSLYSAALEPFEILPLKYEAFNFKYPAPQIAYDPVSEKGVLFTKKVAECTAQSSAVELLNSDRHREILNSYEQDIDDRSVCIIDQNFGSKLISTYVNSYFKTLTGLPEQDGR